LTGSGMQRPAIEVWSHRGRVDPVTFGADNTARAISGAFSSGADGVEIDTWLCADGVFVLSHDRETPAGLIDRCPLASLGGLDRLDEVLFSGGAKTLNIELKVPPDSSPADQARLGEALASLLEQSVGTAGHHGSGDGPALVVSSFSEHATRTVVAAGLALRTGHLCNDVPDARILEDMADRGYWGVHFLASKALPESAGIIRAAGLAAVAWTVNDPEETGRLIGSGVDVIISDTPVAVHQLASRTAGVAGQQLTEQRNRRHPSRAPWPRSQGSPQNRD
jgi:glycerophosphoryl diester phosphodiesterase